MEVFKIDLNCIKKVYKKRPCDSNKGTHGHVLLIAGSENKIGAAIIASKACLRSGAGLVTVSIPKSEKVSLSTSIPEAMFHFRDELFDFSGFNSIGIGPGLNQDEAAQKLLYSVLSKVKYSVVFDADALNILAKNQDWLSLLPYQSILTPHLKEFDRLFGEHQSELERRTTAIQKAAAFNCIIVLKGHKTFITNGTDSFENTTGNSGLAKGGSGDALTGIIAALLAQGYTSLEAAKFGVYLHGLAADITLKNQSEESMLITDVIENIGLAFKSLNSEIQ